MAPDATGNGAGYTSTVPMHDLGVLTTICDTYPSACNWITTYQGFAIDGNIGAFFRNESVDTYIKNSTGTFEPGSKAGTEYFHVNGMVWCDIYAGYDLPAVDMATICLNDAKCSGFTMQTDNLHGDLCAFAAWDQGAGYFKLK
jgi:hypothetical protein